jgi:splicing factor, arginine/serine-rich 16
LKNKREPKAQIGYTYEDSTGTSNYQKTFEENKKTINQNEPLEEEGEEEEEDLDIALDIDKLTPENKVILNTCATNYGMQYGDYIHMLLLDNEEKEMIKRNTVIEQEKAQYSVSNNQKQ